MVLARIGRPHGVRGEVTIEVRTDAPEERFVPGARLATDPPERGPLLLDAARPQGPGWVLAITGVDSREAAEELRNTLLLMAAEDRPELDRVREFYDSDLIGLQVSESGAALGTVRAVTHHGTDLLVVDRSAGGDLLIPFVAAIVTGVSVEEGTLTVDLPPGLLEL